MGIVDISLIAEKQAFPALADEAGIQQNCATRSGRYQSLSFTTPYARSHRAMRWVMVLRFLVVIRTFSLRS